jgi:hypothetical protein
MIARKLTAAVVIGGAVLLAGSAADARGFMMMGRGGGYVMARPMFRPMMRPMMIPRGYMRGGGYGGGQGGGGLGSILQSLFGQQQQSPYGGQGYGYAPYAPQQQYVPYYYQAQPQYYNQAAPDYGQSQ